MQPEPVPMSAICRPSPESLFAAGAEFAEGEAVERDFDEVFGFGAGDEDVRGDFEFEAPEFLFAGEVLGWFAVRAAGDEGEEASGVGDGEPLFGMGVEPGAVAVEDMEQQEFCG